MSSFEGDRVMGRAQSSSNRYAVGGHFVSDLVSFQRTHLAHNGAG